MTEILLALLVSWKSLLVLPGHEKMNSGLENLYQVEHK